jgi:HK97 family phage prohead protease
MEHQFKIKAIESKAEVDGKGIVIAYINAFSNVDAQGDVSLPGSFNRTIKNNFGRIKHLKDHNRSDIVGLPKEFKADDFGLRVVSQLNLNIPSGKDLFANYQFFAENNRSLEHSIGAFAVKYQIIETESRYGYDVEEWKLMEYSTVAFGANEFSTTIGIKSEIEYLQVLAKIETMANLPYSDETKIQLEQLYNVIEKSKHYSGLIIKSPQPGNQPPAPIDKKKLEIEISNLLFKHINF